MNPPGLDVTVNDVAVEPIEDAVKETFTAPPRVESFAIELIVGVVGTATLVLPAARLVIDPFLRLLIVMTVLIHMLQMT